ncbi:MAG TPA: phasin family protein [Thermoanaerobaculia bacterium]|jgi:poly(hydroxyalkanoate) granule-associated protein|nr:phasin family protein [Thermoanaerobaculia bacterium]
MESNNYTGTTGTTAQEKNVQEELKDSVHRIWLAGLGALAAAEEEGNKLFSRLVERGRDVESKGKVEVDKVKAEVDRMKTKAESTFDTWGDKLGERFDDKLTATLHRLGVPTRDEIRNLTQRVEELNAKVEQLKPRVTPAAGPDLVTPETAVTPTDPSKIIV